MFQFHPTIILRHRKENLRKCSLRGLENREDLHFLTYPDDPLPELTGYVVLALGAPPLTEQDSSLGLFLVDATWRYASKMMKHLPDHLEKRSIPPHFRTVYPRFQTCCSDPDRGLASVEALYIAHSITGKNREGLLDNYYWKESFLQKNIL